MSEALKRLAALTRAYRTGDADSIQVTMAARDAVDEIERAACLNDAYRAMPKEPTDAMVWAMCAHIKHNGRECLRCPATVETNYGPGTQGCRVQAQGCYKAMLAAVPAPLPCNHDLQSPDKTLKAITDGSVRSGFYCTVCDGRWSA